MPVLPFSNTHFMATPPVTDSLVAQTRVLRGRMSAALPRSGQNHMPVRFSVSPCGISSGVNVTSAKTGLIPPNSNLIRTRQLSRGFMIDSYLVLLPDLVPHRLELQPVVEPAIG